MKKKTCIAYLINNVYQTVSINLSSIYFWYCCIRWNVKENALNSFCLCLSLICCVAACFCIFMPNSFQRKIVQCFFLISNENVTDAFSVYQHRAHFFLLARPRLQSRTICTGALIYRATSCKH